MNNAFLRIVARNLVPLGFLSLSACLIYAGNLDLARISSDVLERFFRNLPVDSGVAFIVVQHLSADHKSLMV